MKKSILLMLVFLIVSQQSFSVFAEDTSKDYCAYSIGEGDDADYDEFVSLMNIRGFTEYIKKTNNSTSPSLIPTGLSLQNSKYADIAYFTGHGFHQAYMPIYRNYQDGFSNYYQAFCAESTAVDFSDYPPNNPPIPKYEIGTAFKSGSTTKTESIWKDDLEWAIFAACSQLDYGSQGDGNWWNGLNNAQIWARTLLGDGNRAHGILGYYGSAPGDRDVTVVQNFILYSFGTFYPNPIYKIPDAWRLANEWNLGFSGSNWAVVYHNANYDDYMLNMTSDTPNGSAYTIKRKARGSTTQTMPLAMNNNVSLSATNNSLFSNAMIDNYQVDKIEKNDREYIIKKNTVKNDVENIQLKDLQHKIINYNKLKSELLGGSYEKVLEKNGESYYSNNEKRLNILKNGKIEFRDVSIEEDKKVSIDTNEAVDIAKKYLQRLDLLPSDNYQVYISTIETSTMSFADNALSEEQPDITEYNVIFIHTYNGIPILASDDEGISVIINNKGVKSLDYSWREIQIDTRKKEDIKIIEQTVAIDKYIENFDKLYKSKDKKVEIEDVSLMYYYDKNSVVPVWSFSLGKSRDLSMIDAVNNEVIHQ